jgi:hypothetical protein
LIAFFLRGRERKFAATKEISDLNSRIGYAPEPCV